MVHVAAILEVSVQAHKHLKGLQTENLRDHKDARQILNDQPIEDLALGIVDMRSRESDRV